MLTIPPIAPPIVIRKRGLQALETHIRAAHDSLPHVIEAVNHVPMVVFLQLVTGRHATVDCDDGVEAV